MTTRRVTSDELEQMCWDAQAQGRRACITTGPKVHTLWIGGHRMASAPVTDRAEMAVTP